MPAAITADWPKVRDTAVALQSIKLAAEHHKIPYDAAKQRAKREEWPVGRRINKVLAAAQQAHAKAILIANPNAVTDVTSTSDAIVSTLATRQKNTKLHLSKYIEEAARSSTEFTGPSSLLIADNVNKVASVMEKVWPEEKVKNDSGLVAIQLIRMELPKEEKIVLDYPESQATLPAQ